MATDKQKLEVLAQTKHINALKKKRNTYTPASPNKKALQSIIEAAEAALEIKRVKYGI